FVICCGCFSILFCFPISSLFFLFTASATTEFYTLSLHDALPIWFTFLKIVKHCFKITFSIISTYIIEFSHLFSIVFKPTNFNWRSEEHTSELQSRFDLVCRLLLEKKKKNKQQCRQ